MLTPEQVKCMIFEVYRGKLDKSCINESQVGVPEGMMRVTGVAAQLGVKNRNGRIYTEENYLKHIELLQADIEAGLYGELEHPEGFTINNNNISHKIEKVWYNPDTKEVMITILLLDTEKGKIAQSIIKSGGKLHVSSRAMGTVGKNSEAIINKLVTYDIVGTPGFKESDLVLDEKLQLINKTSLCESFYMPLSEGNNPSYNPIHNNMPKTNIQLLEAELAKRKAARLNEKYVTQDQLINNVGPVLTRYINERLEVVENWMVESFVPMYEEYRAKKAINESLGKTACSFGAYYKMIQSERRRLNEGQQVANGQVVLTQEEQKCLQKLAQGQQLTQRQQQIVAQAQQKLQQNLQQQQAPVNEVDQNPQNGEVVLTQEEQKAVQKLQEGQQLDQEEQKLAQQAIDKLQQQQQKIQQQDQDPVNQQDEQQLRESLATKNAALTAAYGRLMEAQDQAEQEKISQECDQLKQEIQDVQVAIDSLSQQAGQQGQSQKVQQALQKIQQGQQLTQQEIDDLDEDELQQIIQQSQQGQQTNEGTAQNYDDPNDAKVFENQQCIKQVQQICQQLQDSGKLSQQQQKVVEKLQQGEQLTEQELKQVQQICQEQGIDETQQEAIQQQQQLVQQQLPENDEPTNESVIGRAAADTLRRSGSLLEALQNRMHFNLGN